MSFGDLPIGVLPGSVPDAPDLPVQQNTTPPPPAAAEPLSGRVIAERMLYQLALVRGYLERLVQLQESPTVDYLSAGTVPGSGTVGTTAAQVLEANPRRRGLNVQNTGTAGNLTVGLGITSPQSGSGIVLAPGGNWDGRVSGMVWKGRLSVIGSASGVEYSWLEAM